MLTVEMDFVLSFSFDFNIAVEDLDTKH